MQVPLRAMPVSEIDGPDNTYIAAFTALNVGVAATTDIVTLYNSASKVIRIVQVAIQGNIATAAATFIASLELRTTVFAGGTAVNLATGPLDSNDPALTATNLKSFTAAPAAGTAGTKLGSQKLFLPIAGSAQAFPAIWNFANIAGAKAVYLRPNASSQTQGIALTLSGATPANATSLEGWIIWTERDN